MTQTVCETAVLSNGVNIPRVGLGVWKIPNEQAADAVSGALRAGYRLVDTAAVYRNEEGVGEGIRRSGIPREDIFLSTKLWNDDIRSGCVEEAFERSLRKLGVEYIDLYLMHWPVPERFTDAWEQMLRICESGRARAVGVCNCTQRHLEELERATGVRPAVDQVERHPRLSQQPLLEYCKSHGILLQAYSPLMQGDLNHPLFAELAAAHGCTPAQIILRWHLQSGVAVIPKSTHLQRQKENLDVFRFSLSDEEMERIHALDCGGRLCADPDHFDF